MAQVRVRKRGGYSTKDAAYKAGVAAFNDFMHGNIGITSEAVTLKDFMTTWLENVVALNVKPTSLQNYQSHFKKHIVPHLGALKVQSLTPAMLDKWVRDLQNGLTWADVDFAGKRINLRRQMVYISKRGFFFTTLKTESSERYILVDDYLLCELRRWQSQQLDGEKISLVCAFVCHTHATQLIEAERLSHSNTLITQNLYTHNTLKLQADTLAISAQILQTTSCCRQGADVKT